MLLCQCFFLKSTVKLSDITEQLKLANLLTKRTLPCLKCAMLFIALNNLLFNFVKSGALTSKCLLIYLERGREGMFQNYDYMVHSWLFQ